MPRNAGRIALAAALTLSLCSVAGAKPLVQSKTKTCGTSNPCILNMSNVPAGVHWVVRQIACLQSFSPRTITVQAHFLIVQGGAGGTAAIYPFQPFRLGDNAATANYADEANVFINVASGEQMRFIFSIADPPTTSSVQCTLSGESFPN